MRKELAVLALGLGTLGALHDVRASEPERITPVVRTEVVIFEPTPIISEKVPVKEKVIGIDFTTGTPVPIRR